jgi:hypothetical protein
LFDEEYEIMWGWEKTGWLVSDVKLTDEQLRAELTQYRSFKAIRNGLIPKGQLQQALGRINGVIRGLLEGALALGEPFDITTLNAADAGDAISVSHEDMIEIAGTDEWDGEVMYTVDDK